MTTQVWCVALVLLFNVPGGSGQQETCGADEADFEARQKEQRAAVFASPASIQQEAIQIDPFHFNKEVLQNNYGNKAIDAPSWNKVFQKRAGMADFAIAIIVPRAIACNVKTRVPPEMEGRVNPGFTSKGEPMRKDRDVWVV